MTILKKTSESINEKDFRKKVEEFGKQISLLPEYQIFDIARGNIHPKDSFIKQWQRIVKNFLVVLKMVDEDGIRPTIEMVYDEIRYEICIFINEKKKSEMFQITPAKKIPQFVYWRLVKKIGERSREANKNRLKIKFNKEFQEDMIKDWKNLNPHYIFFENQGYILIDDIAEHVGLSSQTLRNWEKKGKIKFTHISYKSTVKRIPFLRVVPENEVSNFVDEIRKIKEQHKLQKPPIGYVSAKEAAKKHNIHYSALRRWRDSGRIEFKRVGREFFYKV